MDLPHQLLSPCPPLDEEQRGGCESRPLLTAAELAEIRSRMTVCSPGPWYHNHFGFIEVGFGGAAQVIGVMSTRTEPGLPPLPGPENAEFMAHSRTDVPRLLAEVERLQAENERLQAALAAAQSSGFGHGTVEPSRLSPHSASASGVRSPRS